MRYEVTTKLTPQEALDRASAHFGPQGEGWRSPVEMNMVSCSRELEGTLR